MIYNRAALLRRKLLFFIVLLLLAVLGTLIHLGVIELPAQVARQTHVLFNYGEAAVWGIAGVYVLWRSRHRPKATRILGSVASVAFFAFGISDLVETRTGTWYEPWWLLAWKAACVLILLSCLYFHARDARPRR